LVAATVAWLVLQDGTRVAKVPGGGATDAQGQREARLGELLGSLASGLGHGTTGPLASPNAAQQLAAIDGNVGRIGFSTLSLRYVAPAEQTGAQLVPADTWVADVQVTWRFRRYDVAQSVLEVPMVVADDGKQARFAGFATPQGNHRIPLWLLERFGVRKGSRTLVLSADPQRLPALEKLARTAVPTVGKVLPDWHGSLVLEEPSSQTLLDEAVGADPTITTQLAGVTTTTDGAVTRGAATHVLLNPDVFDRLGPQASQIVVSHEATHVATDGAVSSMPQWLVEGFADYVALRDAGLPVTVSAGQILAEVRKGGAPTVLPTGTDFGGEAAHLGATYESAWLACRLLAQKYGEDRLVEFYRASDRASATSKAFRTVLGTSEAAFTRSWSSYLAQLASGS
jgi:hypothetical protein